MSQLENTPVFNPAWYRSEYRDVEILQMDPLQHYLKYGGLMRRNPSPFFDARSYAERHDLQMAENPLLHFVKTYGAPPLELSKFPIEDLRQKLWGGFSELTVELLKDCFGSRRYNNKAKGEAAFLLGRWYALSGAWEESVKYLKMISKFDIKLFRSGRCKLLLVEALSQAGEYPKAQEMIDFVLHKAVDGHFTCALSNLLALRDGDSPNSHVARLEALNRLFRDAGLSEMKLADPDQGLVFGNWQYDIPAPRSVQGPKVSVLMPVYGAEEFIEVALRSILAQSWQNLEIIAVEDRSPDRSWDILQRLAKEDDRLKICRNDVNMGAYPTRNRALSLASGDFITVHDSDDWSHPQMIEVQMRALLSDPALKGTCSAMARVYPDLRFILRPQRNNLEYVHRSYPSLLMRRSDIAVLNQWDQTSANADDEFIQRARLQWGDAAIADVMSNVPLSLFLVHENSLTQQKGTNLNSLTFGIRREYARQAKYWRDRQQALQAAAEIQGVPPASDQRDDQRGDQDDPPAAVDLSLARTSLKHPFPIPQGLAPKNWEKNSKYDIVLISDLSLLGGTRRCNEGYIEAATALGLRVGLFHWPRFDLKVAEVADEYVALSYQDNVDILVPEDEVEARLILIHHPPLLKYRIDGVPAIKAEKLAILVNQSPMQRWSNAPHYYQADAVAATCQTLFGLSPEWVAISPRVKEILKVSGGFEQIRQAVWYPPYHGGLPKELPDLPAGFGSARSIVIGRHARDHWSKWPARPESLAAAYCADQFDISTRLLGGSATPDKLLGRRPKNWEVLEFDSIDVPGFVRDLDFFLHFVHEDYIEEFGRNVMEAMAAGRVCILAPNFRDIFGEAALYCAPEEVAGEVRRLWADPKAYQAQAQRGLEFVRANCAQPVIQANLQNIL